MEYHEAFSDLSDVVLEESWVMDIAPATGALSLRLEAVLAPGHPRYRRPRPGELDCYCPAWLTIRSSVQVEIHLSGTPPAVDAVGEPDYGHVDRFAYNADAEYWEVEGDWDTPV